MKLSRHLEETLEKNLAALRAHQSELFRLLMRSPLHGCYETVTNGDGQLTLARVDAAEELLPVMPGANPIGYARAVVSRIPDPPSSVILAGAGDGMLLAMLAARRADPVLVVEPDPELLLRAMQIHDLSADKGPIRDSRFVWCVGPGWVGRCRKLLLDEPAHGTPIRAIRGGSPRPEIESSLDRLATELARPLAWIQDESPRLA